jgi:glycosyltransferase involved in cell wall biosynthesis
VNISIAMCTYNGEPYLSDQLDSILDQTRLPDELVVCDDGSSDSTLSTLQSFKVLAPFPVRIYRNSRNLGSTQNYERAISLCEGDIIALADQDDVWRQNKLASMETVFSTSPDTALVFTDAEVVDQHLQPLGYHLWKAIRFARREQRLVAQGRTLDVLLKHHIVTGATMSFRADYRALVLPISPIWVHDAWITLLIATFAPLTMIREPLILYRQHPKSQIGTVVSFSAHLATLPTNGPASYMVRYEQYKAARDRLSVADAVPGRVVVLARLEAKMAHMRARAFTPERKLRRLTTLLRELVTLRYHRYSSGLYSFSKDLLLTWG